MSDNISFKSKINFVSLNNFKKIINQKCKFVPYGTEDPLYIKSKALYTESIRTCTAGGITDGKRESLGFHILDNFDNELNIHTIAEEILNQIQSNNIHGLIIGGKSVKHRPYSLNIFNELKLHFKEKIKTLSYFQEHTYKQSETFYHYDINSDQWTLCTVYQDTIDNFMYAVNSKERLQNAFKEIKIANSDSLFIKGKPVNL